MAELKEVSVNWASKEIVEDQMWKMSTKTDGISIRLKLGDGTCTIII